MLKQNRAFVTSLCMQLLFIGERGKYHCNESALPVTKKERGDKGETHFIVLEYVIRFSLLMVCLRVKKATYTLLLTLLSEKQL